MGPRVNEDLGKTNKIPHSSKIKYMENDPDITKPRYREYVFPVPWPVVLSRFHCTENSVPSSRSSNVAVDIGKNAFFDSSDLVVLPVSQAVFH